MVIQWLTWARVIGVVFTRAMISLGLLAAGVSLVVVCAAWVWVPLLVLAAVVLVLLAPQAVRVSAAARRPGRVVKSARVGRCMALTVAQTGACLLGCFWWLGFWAWFGGFG